MRRLDSQKDLYNVIGANWTRQSGRLYDFACADIEGALVQSSFPNYGLPFSSASIVFWDKTRQTYVNLIDWTVVYQWVGEDISYGAWACQDPMFASIPVGFDPTLALLSAQRLFLNSNATVTRQQVLDASEKLHTNFATRIVADGTSAGVVVYRVGEFFEDDVRFTISSSGPTPAGSLSQFDSQMMTSGGGASSETSIIVRPPFVELEDKLGQKSRFAFATYRAPAPAFNDSSSPATLTLTVENGEELRNITLPIIAPPVVLVHGLWGNDTTFSSWPSGSASDYPAYKFTKFMYDGSRSFRDSANQTKLMNTLRSIQNDMTVNGVIGSRVDIVSHSMGGLMTRQFLNSDANRLPRATGGLQLFGTSPVRRFVTLDTPHKGSPMADFLWDRRDDPLVVVCPPATALLVFMSCTAISYADTFSELLGRPIDTAIRDMATRNFSEQSLASPGEATGGFASISGVANARDWLKVALDPVLFALSGTTVNEMFEADGDVAHDVIVGLSSQQAYSSEARLAGSFEANHITVTNRTDVKRTVLCFLGGGSCSIAASGSQKLGAIRSGKGEPGPEWNLDLTGRTFSNYPGTINLDAPLQQGFNGSLHVTIPGRAVAAAYLTFESSAFDRQFYHAVQPSPGYEWIRFSGLPVPQADVMHVTILAVMADNTVSLFKQDFPVTTAPINNYGNMRMVNSVLALDVGQSETLQMIGSGNAGNVIFPASQYSISVLTGADVISIDSEANVTGLQNGTATLLVQNADLGTRFDVNVQVGELTRPEVAAPELIVEGVTFENEAPSVSFHTMVGSPQTKVVSIANRGNANLVISAVGWQVAPVAITIAANTCANATLAPDATCNISLRHAPVAAGTSAGVLRIVSNDPHYATLPIAVTAVADIVYGTATVGVAGVSCSATVGLPAVCVGNPTITASGGPVVLAATPIAISGAHAGDFAVATGSCGGVTLASGSSCTLGVVTFTPGAVGSRSAMLNSIVAQGTPANANLSGTGNAVPVNYGTATVSMTGVTCTGTIGQTSTCAGQPTITATGGPVRLSATPVLTEGPQAAEFVIGAGSCGGALLASGASCTLGTVNFAPTAAGARSTLVLSNVGNGTSHTVTLAGVGNAPDDVPGGTSGIATITLNGVTCNSTVAQATACAGSASIRASGGPVSLAATPVTIGGVQGSEFAIAAGSCGGVSLNAEASCLLGQVTFTPAAAGTRTATLTTAPTAGTGHSVSLSGVATAASGTGGGGGGTGGGSKSGGGGALDALLALVLLSLTLRRLQVMSRGCRRAV